MNAYLNSYKSSQVSTASREQVLLMLYDGVIRFVRQAKVGIEEKDTESKIRYADKAIAILTEFRNTLDHAVGGQIAADLDALYDFMVREIIRAKMNNKPEVLEPVLRILCELREAWGEAIESERRANQNAKAGAAVAQAAI